MSHYLRGEKPEVAHPVAAWSSQTGKGLLFFVKHESEKKTPSGVLHLVSSRASPLIYILLTKPRPMPPISRSSRPTNSLSRFTVTSTLSRQPTMLSVMDGIQHSRPPFPRQRARGKEFLAVQATRKASDTLVCGRCTEYSEYAY